MWTGAVGEAIAGEMLRTLGWTVTKPPKVETLEGVYQPDYEIMGASPRVFVEVKTQTWNTTGTAGEKIGGVPFKYAPLCDIGSVMVITLAGAEREAEKLRLYQEPWVASPKSVQMLKNIHALGVSYVRGSDLLDRCSRIGPPSTRYDTPMAATPLIKWVGGKQKLAPRIASCLAPAITGASTYYEPFVGAGGFLLHLLSAGLLEGVKVVASDTNRRLIEFHTVVQESPEELIAELRNFKYSGGADAYRELRNEYNGGSTGAARARRAAVFYVLMHKSFNGMYRENSSGGFNVPIGQPCGAVAFKITHEVEKSIMAVARLTARVVFVAQDYLEAIRAAACAPAQSFIYADPPYEGAFSGYSAARYSTAELFEAIANSGVAAAISNSLAARPLACAKLPACNILELNVKYSVGATAESRGGKIELLIQTAAAPGPLISDEDFTMLMADLGLDDES
jgi:DNA adenine methylase